MIISIYLPLIHRSTLSRCGSFVPLIRCAYSDIAYNMTG